MEEISAYAPTTQELQERIDLVVAICDEIIAKPINQGESVVNLAQKIKSILQPLLPKILEGLELLEKYHREGDVSDYTHELLEFCRETGMTRFEVEQELDRRARLRG